MSGVPNLNSVKELKQALRDFDWTQGRIADLENTIDQEKKTLERLSEELRDIRARIDAQMVEMDVMSPHNAGWERRYFELLRIMSCAGL